MLGLTSLVVYTSIFIITEGNSKLKLYKFPICKSGGVSYEKVSDEIERDLALLHLTATNLRDDRIAPNIFEEYRNQVTKRKKR